MTYKSTPRGPSPWLFLAPGLSVILLFLLWPICQGIWYSLHDFDGLRLSGSPSFRNYTALLSDPLFHAALGHTAILATIAVVGKNVLGLGLAMLVVSGLRGARKSQLLLFLPVTLNIVVVGAFWMLFLAPARFGGLLNGGLEAIGLTELARSWLSEQGISLLVVSLIEVWRWIGLHMLIFVAALHAIEPSLYDAARLDGAGAWQRFRHVTLPALRPILIASTMLALIGAFVRSFDIVWVLTRAGYGTDVLGTYIYREAFTFGRFDRATAAGLLLALILGALFGLARFVSTREQSK